MTPDSRTPPTADVEGAHGNVTGSVNSDPTTKDNLQPEVEVEIENPGIEPIQSNPQPKVETRDDPLDRWPVPPPVPPKFVPAKRLAIKPSAIHTPRRLLIEATGAVPPSFGAPWSFGQVVAAGLLSHDPVFPVQAWELLEVSA